MNVRAITTTQEWDAIADSWDSLLSDSVTSNVFLTYDWMRTWWDYYGDNKAVIILIAEDKKGICGIAPLYIAKERTVFGIYEKVIRFIGDEGVGSDFLEMIIHPRRLVDTITAIFEYLWKEIEWDRMCLQSVDGYSPCHTILFIKAERMGAVVRRNIHNICPVMVLPESLAEFNLQHDRGFKHTIVQKDLRNIKKDFPDIKFEDVGIDDDVSEYIEHFFALHEERWKLSGQSGNFYDKRKRAFYRKIAQIMLPKKRLRLSYLYFDNKIEMIEFGLVYADSYYFLQSGISTKGLRYEAGKILSYLLFNDMMGKYKQIELLRGDELYKYYLGCMNRYTLKIDIAKSLMGRLSCAFSILFAGLRTAARFILGKKRN